MIFGKRWAEIAFAVPALGIGVILAIFPLDDVIRQIITGGAGAVYALFIPAIHVMINEHLSPASWTAILLPCPHFSEPSSK